VSRQPGGLPAGVTDLVESSPRELDLKNSRHLAAVTAAAESFLRACPSSAELARLEQTLLEHRHEIPLLLHLAAKLARSKRIASSLLHPVHVTVVFSMYREHERIRTLDEHPHGEDFLRRKIGQLDWLASGCPFFGWDMIAVDDGCPEGSGQIAESILEKHAPGAPAAVLYLTDAIARGLPVTADLSSADESQKGGGIQYGMWHAVQTVRPGHIVLFTDADLSTHLGQAGLLVDEIVAGGRLAAIGSRREPQSVAVKQGSRNTRGKLFIYLWKRLISPINYIVDTQCGFKAFRDDVVRRVVEDLIEKRFAFDIELLLRVELISPGSIAKVPVAWIDSDAASTTTALQPYLPMLQSVVRFYRRYLPATAGADQFADFIEQLDADSWDRLASRIPPEIADADPSTFAVFDGVSVVDLAQAATAGT
jgi:hypothetical protein